MKMIACGNTAEVFDLLNGRVLKLFYRGYPAEYAALEFRNAQVLAKENLPVPNVFALVEQNGRLGIEYEKIAGCNPLKLYQTERAVDLLIDLQQQFLNVQTRDVVSYRDFLSHICLQDTVKKKIQSLPEGECLCHGDLHFENILVQDNGIAVVIDFMNVCLGVREYEIARTYFLLRQYGETYAQLYLQKSETEYSAILPYLNIIAECREFEKSEKKQ